MGWFNFKLLNFKQGEFKRNKNINSVDKDIPVVQSPKVENKTLYTMDNDKIFEISNSIKERERKIDFLSQANQQKIEFEQLFKEKNVQGVRVRLKDCAHKLHQEIADDTYQLKTNLEDIRPYAAEKMTEKLREIVQIHHVDTEESLKLITCIHENISGNIPASNFKDLKDLSHTISLSISENYPEEALALTNGKAFGLNEQLISALSDDAFKLTPFLTDLEISEKNQYNIEIKAAESQEDTLDISSKNEKKELTLKTLLMGKIRKFYATEKSKDGEVLSSVSLHMSDNLLNVEISEQNFDTYISKNSESQEVCLDELLEVANALMVRVHPDQVLISGELKEKILDYDIDQPKKLSLKNIEVDKSHNTINEDSISILDKDNPIIGDLDQIEFDDSQFFIR